MPQMKPLNWIMMFIITNLILMIFIMINYYIISYKFKFSNKNIVHKNNNWKW